jgi:hypothetical protein
MPTYTIFNQSTVVNTTNLNNMVKAMNTYLTSVCTDWGLAATNLVVGTGTRYPNNTILLQDLTDEPGALGYHYEDGGKVIGKVFAKTIINYGGAVLYKDNWTFTVAQCLCHELLEMMGNPQINKWHLDNNGIFWAAELCDPVESNLVVYTLPGNIKVGLSDYVLPNWFSPDVTTRPFNKLNTLSGPFRLSPGGYAIIIDNYNVEAVYGMSGSNYITGTYSSNGLLAIKAAERQEEIEELQSKFKK